MCGPLDMDNTGLSCGCSVLTYTVAWQATCAACIHHMLCKG